MSSSLGHTAIIRAPIAVIFAATTLFASPCLAQNIRYVRASAPSNGDGLSWATAHQKLFDALDAVHADGSITQIWIAAASYTPKRIGGDRDDAFDLAPTATLYGGFSGVETALTQRNPAVNITILSGDNNGNDAPGFANMGDNAHHVVTALNFAGAATLDGLVVRQGNADFDPDDLMGGGGLFIQAATVNLVNCTFQTNSAGTDEPAIGGFGGAIYNLGGTITASQCLFVGNRGINGGAIGLRDLNGSTLGADFTNCQFVGNDAHHQTGGVMWTGVSPFDTVERHLTITNCLFEDNLAQYGGAIIEQNIKHVKIIGCTFRFNHAFVVAGAIWHNQSANSDQEPIAITRCVFQDNHGEDAGGALFFTATDAIITNCKFLGNSSTGVGGAIRSGPQFGASFGSGDLLLANCQLTGNTAPIGGAIAALRNPTARVVNCSIAGNTATQVGGGVFSDALSLDVDNSIFWLNKLNGAATQAAQIVHQTTFGPLTIDACCVQGWTGSLGGEGNFGSDPLLLDLDGPDDTLGTADDDVHIAPDSPVRNAAAGSSLPTDSADLDSDGDTAEPLALDLDDQPRIIGREPDMGAYELPSLGVIGDLDDDGHVGPADLAQLLSQWGRCANPKSCPADLNGDGAVGPADLAQLLAHWG